MTSTYKFSISGSKFMATRTEPRHVETRGVLIHEEENGYGSTGIFQDFNDFPKRALNSYDFFEYFNGKTGRYYRIPVSDINYTTVTPDPEPLDVRHAAWPGKSRREMEIELHARRKRKIAKAIMEARQRKARVEREQRRQEEEARIQKEVDIEFARSNGTDEEAIRKALEEAGLE